MCVRAQTSRIFGFSMVTYQPGPHMRITTHPNLSASAPNDQAGLTAADHSLGLEDAPITLLEYGDYECPACAKAAPVVRQLVERFGPQLRFVFRHLPLVELHPYAELAAEATEAAAAQGKFWEMHHLLSDSPHHLSLPNLTQYAQTIGLDMSRFHAEMADHIYTQRVQEHRRAAALGGVHKTPTFILNGQRVDTSDGLDILELAIQAEAV